MKKNKRIKKRNIAKISLLALSTQIALGTMIQAAELENEAKEAEEAVEVITVSGIRSSMINASIIKRDNSSISDVISSEDIGKLPDENVAETLQRITGVQISRRNGEGAGVSVRGLEQNRLEVDGVTLVNPTGRNSGPDESTFPVLQFIPSELLSGVEVAKSASADQIAGSLGGTVNLTLLKPLSIGDKVSVAVQGSYDDRTEQTDPRFSLVYSQTNDDNTFGALLSYTNSKRSLGEELFFTRTGWSGIDTDDDGIQDSNFAPGDLRMQTLEEDRTRTSYLANLQWRPSESTEFYLTGIYADFDIERDRSWFSSADSGGSDLANYTNPVITADSTIISGGFTSQIQGNGEHLTNDSDTYSVSLGGQHVIDNWLFSGKVTTGKATQVDLQDFARIRQNGVAFQRDLTGTIPSLDVVDDFDVLDPESYNLSSGLIGFSNDTRYKSEESSVQFDINYEFDNNPFISSVELGARLANQESSKVHLRAGADDGNSVWLVPIVDGLAAGTTDALFHTVSLSDVYGGTVSNQAAFLAANPTGLGGTADLLGFANDNSPGGSRSNQGVFVELSDGNSIEEDIFSVYLKGNFDFEIGEVPVSGDFGVRYIDTDQNSNFSSLTSNGSVPGNFKRSYDDVLPSLNVKFDFEEDLVLRLAASQVISRPSTSDLSGGLTIDDPAGTATGGNPALDPAKANAYDLSLEWYINDLSSLSTAVFYKDVTGFLESITEYREIPGAINLNPGDTENVGTNNFLVTSVAATESSTIKGIELAYQNVWENGFGVQGNFTYIDSDGLGGLPLTGLSETSYNVVGFYEQEDYSVRLAYNWRDDYLVTPSFNGSALFQTARGQLDFSANYDIKENITISFEAINMNDEGVEEYATLTERQFRVANTGRRFFVGVRASF